MDIRQILTLYLLLYMAVCSTAFAQPVDIPDPALNKVIRWELNLAPGSVITRQDMLKLTRLDGHTRDITSLSGLQHAVNMVDLTLPHNLFSDISALAGMRKLTGLNLWGCRNIEDVTPLANLTNLRILLLAMSKVSDIRPLSGLMQLDFLELQGNQIVDISPLSSLTNLTGLDLEGNQIVDFSPLQHLVNLNLLWIHDNLGTDFTPLQNLMIADFKYDEVCDISIQSPSIEERIKGRQFPSIFQAWDGIIGLDHLSIDERNELHDLHYSPSFGLHWDKSEDKPAYGIATSIVGDLKSAYEIRNQKLQSNPNMIFLKDVRIHNHFFPGAFPPNSEFWIRDANGNIVQNFAGEHMINFLKPEVQILMANRMLAVDRCGLYDGIMIDGFFLNATGFVGRIHHDASDEDIIQATTNILRMVREQARDDFLILVNTNHSKATAYTEFVNGTFMETGVPASNDPTMNDRLIDVEGGLRTIEDTLLWSEEHFRYPQINCLEGWAFPEEPPDSAYNLKWMRLMTTLGLTHSDGYVMFNDGHSHAHIWYEFWNADLGQPVGSKAQLYKDIDGLFIREFTNGWAVYNRSGKAQQIEFPEKVSSVTSGLTVANHAVLDLDGDMFLKVETKNPADVNGDGIVNILDLILVAQGIGTGDLTADVNEDGVVNVFDLVFVADQF